MTKTTKSIPNRGHFLNQKVLKLMVVKLGLPVIKKKLVSRGDGPCRDDVNGLVQ